jgi:2-dehydro-3-deoxygluconokinase
VGADGFGTAITRRLRGEGVDVTHLTTDDQAPTGLMLRERRGLGASQALYHRRGSAGSRLTPDDVDAAASIIRAASWLHVTGITPALGPAARAAHARALAIATAAGVPVSFDINLRRLLWTDAEAAEALAPLVERATVVLGSPDELAVVAGVDDDGTGEAAATVLHERGVPTVVAKVGERGAILHGPSRAALHVAALRVPHVVDPIGAGDAFCAGFLAARLEGLDDPVALRWAVACGAAAVTVDGDMDGLPDRSTLDRLIAGSPGDIVR